MFRHVGHATLWKKEDGIRRGGSGDEYRQRFAKKEPSYQDPDHRLEMGSLNEG